MMAGKTWKSPPIFYIFNTASIVGLTCQTSQPCKAGLKLAPEDATLKEGLKKAQNSGGGCGVCD